MHLYTHKHTVKYMYYMQCIYIMKVLRSSRSRGGHWAYWIRSWHAQIPQQSVWVQIGLLCDSSFLINVNPGRQHRWFRELGSCWVLVTQTGVPSSWLCPGPVLPVMGIYQLSQQMGTLSLKKFMPKKKKKELKDKYILVQRYLKSICSGTF